MKQIKLFTSLFIFSLAIAIGCKKETEPVKPPIPPEEFIIPEVSNTNLAGDICSKPYEISLVRRGLRADGNWEWIWGVKNTSPGDGTKGTLKDITSFAITLPECIKLSNIKASYAFVIHGPDQYHTGFTPTYQPDNTFKDCSISSVDVTQGKPVVKFNFGTRGNVITYYEIILDKEYPINPNGVCFYKSACSTEGTGVGSSCFPGVGCK
jgi:hypothetical protein